MSRLLIVLLCGLLAGCAFLETPQLRRERAEADIMEMYRTCLRQKQTNPSVDCSDFRTAIEIRRER